MEDVQPLVAAQASSSFENRTLYLPSNLSGTQRLEYNLTHLASEEAQLREGQAGDIILQLRRVEKTLSAQHGLRKKNITGQTQATRARSKIHQTEFLRDTLLDTYESCRRALKALDHLQPNDGSHERPL